MKSLWPFLPLDPPRSVAEIPRKLRLFRDESLEVYYAPFDYRTPDPRVVLVGLTPGWHQASMAYRTFAEARVKGRAMATALRLAKGAAPFSGPIRANLCNMLDEVGLAAALNLSSTRDLFGHSASLVHVTAALRYPVFRLGRNYSGVPSLVRHPYLRQMVETLLAEELQDAPHAVIMPLGGGAESAVAHLVDRGLVDSSRSSLPCRNPSGANAHRFAQLRARRRAFAVSCGPGFEPKSVPHATGSLVGCPDTVIDRED